MHAALIKYKADGVLGPVEPRFCVKPADWIMKSGIFERPNGPGYRTGSVLDWKRTGTGNVLMQRRVFDGLEGPFRPTFGSGGEDLDFFRRAMEKGSVFVWCEEAIAYESVPVERTRVSFQLKRALLRGKVALSHPSSRGLGILNRSLPLAFTLFASVVLLLAVGTSFLQYLVKDCDHLGKLLAFCGISAIRQKYVIK